MLLLASTKMPSTRRSRCFGGVYASDRRDETMPLILDDKQPIILVPDNSPITARG